MMREELLHIRQDVFRMAMLGGAGHLASSFSSVELLYALYLGGVMRYDASRPDWPERDRLILSKGHAAMALYAVLSRAGLLERDALWSYLKPDQPLGGEPCSQSASGIEAATGSLGHGLSQAVGMAYAAKLDHRPSRVFALLGDGELQEGSVWEAVMSAAHLQLDSLTVIVDQNGLQKMDSVANIMSITEYRSRFEAFGWEVVEADGHDVDAIVVALNAPVSGLPRVLLAHTIKGKGVSLMENDPQWHYKLPNKRDRKAFLRELNMTEDDLCKSR